MTPFKHGIDKQRPNIKLKPKNQPYKYIMYHVQKKRYGLNFNETNSLHQQWEYLPHIDSKCTEQKSTKHTQQELV